MEPLSPLLLTGKLLKAGFYLPALSFLRYVWFSAPFSPPVPYEAADKVVSLEPASCLALAAKGTDDFHCKHLISRNLIRRCFDMLGGKHRFCAGETFMIKTPVLLLGLHTQQK